MDQDGQGQGQQTDTSEALPSYEPPNMNEAKHYRDSTLPRRLRDPSQPSGFRLAGLGEEKDQFGNSAQPYPLFFSKTDVLNEFGVGVSLYFKTLKALFCLLFFCAFISLVAMYQNRKFNPDQEDIDLYRNYTDISGIDPTPIQLVGSVYGADRSDLSFSQQGASDIVCCVLICLFALFGGFLEDHAVTKIDTAQQTTQDYSIVVLNPPTDVTDPDEYAKYFKKFGDVVFVTIATRNGALIKNLAERKVLEGMVQGMVMKQEGYQNLVVERGSTITSDKVEENLSLAQKLGLAPTIKGTLQQIEKLRNKILGLSNQTFTPWKVFVTFNKETEQRACLREMNAGKFKFFSAQSVLFHGKSLYVTEAAEPSAILYENSHVRYTSRVLSWILSYFISGCLMVASFFIIRALSNTGNVGVAIFVSMVNAMLPGTLKYLTQTVEVHIDVRHIQQSMLLKLVAARCINSALLIYLATKYDETFGIDSLQQMQNILIADAITTPLFRLLNLYDFFMRYVYAPWYSRTQEEFNAIWAGADWTLAERYTDVLKTIFVGLFFLVPLPSGLFITAFAMMSTYVVDKYSLLRIWKRPPQIDKTLGVISRYFYIGIVFCHLSISRVYFANWPYGGLYGQDKADRAECTFFRCAVNDDMTSDQKGVVDFYSGACIAMFAVVIAWIVFYHIIFYIYSSIWGKTTTVGRASNIAFRHVSGIQSYTPVVNRNEFVTPLLCADVSSIPSHHLPINFGSTDTNFNVYSVDEFANISNPELLKPLFSKIKFYPDPDAGIGGDLTGLASQKSFLNTAPSAFPNANPNPQPGSPSQPVYQQQSSFQIPSQQVQPASPPNPNNNTTPQLPPGWERRVTPEGRPFYVDHNTHATNWEPPSFISTQSQPVPHVVQFPQSQPYQAPPPQRIMAPQVSPATVIPMVYANPHQQQHRQSVSPYLQVSLAPSRPMNLPNGWEVKYTPNGKPYYVDHRTRTTHWQLPA